MFHISDRPTLVGTEVILAGVPFEPESEAHGKDLVRLKRARLATDEELAAYAAKQAAAADAKDVGTDDDGGPDAGATTPATTSRRRRAAAA